MLFRSRTSDGNELILARKPLKFSMNSDSAGLHRLLAACESVFVSYPDSELSLAADEAVLVSLLPLLFE